VKVVEKCECGFCGEQKRCFTEQEYRPAGQDLLLAAVCLSCARRATQALMPKIKPIEHQNTDGFRE